MAALGILWDRIVCFGGIRKFGDYVPGVEQARHETQTAKQNVDEGVGATDATFNPDGDGWEEDGQKAEEDVGGTHLALY